MHLQYNIDELVRCKWHGTTVFLELCVIFSLGVFLSRFAYAAEALLET